MTPRRFRAPGRVNLIGEHTDYNDGFVMPAAIAFQTITTAAPRQDRIVTARSAQFGDSAFFSLDEAEPRARGAWLDYVQGVAVMLQGAGYVLRGVDLSIDSTVPIGSGLSSSAALEVSTALAVATLSGHSIPRIEMARLCQQAEVKFVGLQCGIMDQFISLHGKASNAVLLDCRSMEHRDVPLPPQVSIVICNTMVKHELTGSEYNARRRDCEQAAELLGVPSLRDVTWPQFQTEQDKLPERIRKRARHVIQEIERTQQAAEALARGDLDQFGRLMYASHQTLRDDYEVSCKELDLLVDLAREQPGVYGARMTGGGFGGCTVSLVDAARAEDFRAKAASQYYQETGIHPEIYICSGVDGAGEIE